MMTNHGNSINRSPYVREAQRNWITKVTLLDGNSSWCVIEPQKC